MLVVDPCHQKQLEREELELDRDWEQVEREPSWNWEVGLGLGLALGHHDPQVEVNSCRNCYYQTPPPLPLAQMARTTQAHTLGVIADSKGAGPRRK